MIKAVIFDMDGVLTDSEPLICAAAMAMFKEQGCQVKPADFRPFVGTGENRYIGGVAERYGLALDIAAAKKRTYELYLAMVPSRLKAFPGAVAFVRECRRHGLKTAIASSADWIKVEANLNGIGLPPAEWTTLVTAEDVVHRKPAPDIFLAAASKMGFQPDQCVVVEDAINGIEAARAAGMRCVAVAQTFPEHLLTQANLTRPSVDQLTVNDLLGG